jgi:hypothetical protein
VLFFFIGGHLKKFYPYFCFFFWWTFHTVLVCKILKGKEHSRQLLLFIISIERLNNAVLFDDDCDEKRAKNNRSSEQY